MINSVTKLASSPSNLVMTTQAVLFLHFLIENLIVRGEGFSSNGRALALQAQGLDFDTQHQKKRKRRNYF